MRRLLVISCSQSKTRGKGLIPAIDRYDGPAFRVLRKYLHEFTEPGLKILILSAKYGLIDQDHAISDYDCRLSRESALKMRVEVSDRALRIIDSERWDRVGICAGAVYRIALEGLLPPAQHELRLDIIGGGLGTRLTHLKTWLRDHDSADLTSPSGQRERRVGHERNSAAEGDCLRKEAS